VPDGAVAIRHVHIQTALRGHQLLSGKGGTMEKDERRGASMTQFIIYQEEINDTIRSYIRRSIKNFYMRKMPHHRGASRRGFSSQEPLSRVPLEQARRCENGGQALRVQGADGAHWRVGQEQG
jgi:hypothetical protein